VTLWAYRAGSARSCSVHSPGFAQRLMVMVAAVSFTLDRYGHLYPEADTALRDRLDALYGAVRPTPDSTVVRLPRRSGRGPRRSWRRGERRR
jgi:hypothetical protein